MRVVIVDDHELMRRGLSMILGTSPEVDVVGEAAEGREALAAVHRLDPDIVLTDARMPVMDGVALVEELRLSRPGLPVIILTTFDDDDLVRSAVEAGACGFLLKDTSTDDLVHAMSAVIDGGMVLDPRVARAAMSRPAATTTEASPLATLTRAERNVARLVSTGSTNAEIAERLCLAEGTVKNYVSSLLRKLQVRDRTALALLLQRYLG